jgi:hypothetical protein
VTPDAQPPARPALPREFPLLAGAGAVTIAASLHLDAPVVGSHIDLFLGPADAATRDRDARIARSYRLPLSAFAARPTASVPVAGIYDAVELDPHRAEYLALDLPRQLSGDRGRVEPLMQAIGRATVRDDGFEVRWNGWTARGTRIDVSRWRIELSPTEPS